MTKAIRVHQIGGPEVMKWEEIPDPVAKPGEAVIRQTAIGLNFIDCYYRSGLYPSPMGMPLIPGSEGAGIVTSVGEGVTGLAVGDRVAYAGPVGGYAVERSIAADRLVRLPDSVSDRQAAAMMLKGMTASFLLRRTFKVKPGDTILFHAAAGGVGLIAGQWAKHLGATVIGTAGSDDKVELAKAHGYDHVINYRKDNFVEKVREITGGKMCDVVYDSVGADTYMGSLDCLRPMGLLALFGQSSGIVPPFNLGLLAQKGSLYITRPTLFVYIAKRDDLEEIAGSLMDVVAGGIVKIEVNQTYALADAAKAHADLEGRRTTGATVLIP
ncbi:MAG: quinone oxidoreductase [Mesorhizobium sp.]|nr:quinone oxidoreductase [Mesorhizobium sp.]MCO5163565.1 quinone oxidoreductase [Mesorhizobium sp.]